MHMPKRIAVALLAVLVVGCILAACGVGAAFAETYVFEGTASSSSRITETSVFYLYNMNPSAIPNGSKIVYNATCPASSGSGGYSIVVSDVRFDVRPAPSSISGVMEDGFGNDYRQIVWDIDRSSGSSLTLTVITSFDVDISADMAPLSYNDALGTAAYPEYRAPTDLVQSADPAIVNAKDSLLQGVTSEAEAVERVIDFVRVSIPDDDPSVPKDAVTSLGSSRGNCVNRAHLALALLRSAGIPARCVSGMLYGDTYSVSYPISGGVATTQVSWEDGSHVWIEVYYPDEDAWVPYDPYMDSGFVDTRHIKYAHSIDYALDAKTRGEVGLLTVKGPTPSLTFHMDVSASGLKDSIALKYRNVRSSPPVGTIMIARELRASLASTPTPTPTPGPYDATPTATIGPDAVSATPVVTAVASPMLTISPGPVDASKHNVTGTVVDNATGMPVSGAAVRLDAAMTSADASGAFAFPYAVSVGQYTLAVSAPGYGEDEQVLTANGTDMAVDVLLVPDAAAHTPTPTPTPTPAAGLLAFFAALAGGGLLARGRAP